MNDETNAAKADDRKDSGSRSKAVLYDGIGSIHAFLGGKTQN
ncbi:MAG TPA: hypothetical protein VGO49_04165 [Bradyrhizobium sp.]|jgi:hypothetical protein|nr:hypothetical protein [Bradyrhizobium sp.]